MRGLRPCSGQPLRYPSLVVDAKCKAEPLDILVCVDTTVVETVGLLSA